jgi:hypothetical protein
MEPSILRYYSKAIEALVDQLLVDKVSSAGITVQSNVEDICSKEILMSATFTINGCKTDSPVSPATIREESFVGADEL